MVDSTNEDEEEDNKMLNEIDFDDVLEEKPTTNVYKKTPFIK